MNPIKVGVPTSMPGRNGRTFVNVPVWFWVDNRGPSTTGPLVAHRTLHGYPVTLKATMTKITWNLGDGTTMTCGLGTKWTPERYKHPTTGKPVPSPDCGHTYTKVSPPGRPYQITATTHWVFQWSAVGQSGTINVAPITSRPVPITIGELHTVTIGR